MGKINYSDFDCYQTIGSTTTGFCDEQAEGCVAKDNPDILFNHTLFQKNKDGGIIQENKLLCRNCLEKIPLSICNKKYFKKK